MARKRNKSSGVSSCSCDKCGLQMLSIKGKKHRRCGGSEGAEIRPKHSPNTGVRGIWR